MALAIFGVINHGYCPGSRSEEQASPPSEPPTNWKDRLADKARAQPMMGGGSRTTFFTALKREQPIPPSSRQRMHVSLGPQERPLGIRLRQGFLLKTSLGTGIWVIMGHSVTCIFNGRSFAVACDTASNTAKYGLVSVSGPSPAAFRNPPVEAIGIVPNGIRSVRLGVLGRPDHLVPVVRNTFGLRTHRPIKVMGVVR